MVLLEESAALLEGLESLMSSLEEVLRPPAWALLRSSAAASGVMAVVEAELEIPPTCPDDLGSKPTKPEFPVV